jgi:hypothetical protein
MGVMKVEILLIYANDPSYSLLDDKILVVSEVCRRQNADRKSKNNLYLFVYQVQ